MQYAIWPISLLLSLLIAAAVVGLLVLLVLLLVRSETARMGFFAWIAGMLLFGVYLWAHADPVVPGNIDLDNRPVIVWEDGTFSTEISFSIEVDGLEVLLPSVIDGKLVSEEEAVKHFFETGEHLGMFSSIEECELYAAELHLRQEEFYTGR